MMQQLKAAGIRTLSVLKAKVDDCGVAKVRKNKLRPDPGVMWLLVRLSSLLCSAMLSCVSQPRLHLDQRRLTHATCLASPSVHVSPLVASQSVHVAAAHSIQLSQWELLQQTS